MAKGVSTLQPKSVRRRLRVHGFMARMNKNNGRSVKLRRSRGRKRLAVG